MKAGERVRERAESADVVPGEHGLLAGDLVEKVNPCSGAGRGGDEGVPGRDGDQLDLIVGQAGGGVGVIDRAGVKVKDAGIACADEERCGVNGGECSDLQRCRIHAGERELKRREDGAVVVEDSAMACAEQDLSGCEGKQRGEVAGGRRGGQGWWMVGVAPDPD